MAEYCNTALSASPDPLVVVLGRAFEAVGVFVSNVGADQWSAATPCADWDVRRLVDHLNGMNRVFTALLAAQRHQAVSDTPADPDAGLRAWLRAYLRGLVLLSLHLSHPAGGFVPNLFLCRRLGVSAAVRHGCHSACRMTDQAAILQAELVGAPRMVRGSQGQSVANPLLGSFGDCTWRSTRRWRGSRPMFPRRRYDGWRKSGPPCGEYPLAREGRLMPRRLSTTSGVRQRLIDTKQASWTGGALNAGCVSSSVR